MPFAHIKRAPPISLHSWGAKCDEYQHDAYDKIYHNNKVEMDISSSRDHHKSIKF
jgi:hypothetical protein